MSRFSGAEGAGAQRRARAQRKADAIARDAATAPERRRKFQQQRRRIRDLLDEREIARLREALVP